MPPPSASGQGLQRHGGGGAGTSLSGVGRAALQSWEGWGKGSGRADAPQWAWKAQR